MVFLDSNFRDILFYFQFVLFLCSTYVFELLVVLIQITNQVTPKSSMDCCDPDHHSSYTKI